MTAGFSTLLHVLLAVLSYHAHSSSGAGVASLEAPPLRSRASAAPQLPCQQLAGGLLNQLWQDLLKYGQGPVLPRGGAGEPSCLFSTRFLND